MNVYQKINEKVDVLVDFAGHKIRPLVFKWGGRDYQVKNVNLVHMAREGREKIYYFSVSDEANYFKLKYNTESLEWLLEETYAN